MKAAEAQKRKQEATKAQRARRRYLLGGHAYPSRTSVLHPRWDQRCGMKAAETQTRRRGNKGTRGSSSENEAALPRSDPFHFSCFLRLCASASLMPSGTSPGRRAEHPSPPLCPLCLCGKPRTTGGACERYGMRLSCRAALTPYLRAAAIALASRSSRVSKSVSDDFSMATAFSISSFFDGSSSTPRRRSASMSSMLSAMRPAAST